MSILRGEFEMIEEDEVYFVSIGGKKCP